MTPASPSPVPPPARGTLGNPNLPPRPLGTWLAGLVLRPFLVPLRVRRPLPHAVFESYFVGDLFMALPAIKLLAAHLPGLRVICRADCAGLIRAEGLDPLPFDNSFCTKPGRESFFKSLRAAWSLRGKIGSVLDPDADTRTALWMRLAGARRIVSYHRPRAALFDALHPLPADAVHQAERCFATAQAHLRDLGFSPVASMPAIPLRPGAPGAPWIISCWTRLDVKNWPLDRWEIFLQRMRAAGLAFRILEPPDGDADFKAFKARHEGDYEFLSASLDGVAEAIRESAGVVGTDNFNGHMAGFYGKPVLWINGSSDPRHVTPLGPLTRVVQFEPMPCRPCIHKCYNPEYKACLNHLDIERVWAAFEGLHAESVTRARPPVQPL